MRFQRAAAEGKITDPARIDASLDTIRYILEHGGAAVLCSHLGRPKERTPELSLKPVAEYLSTALGQKVALAPDCIGDHTGRMVDGAQAGRGDPARESALPHRRRGQRSRLLPRARARQSRSTSTTRFGTAHRAHASTVGVTRFLAERAAGFLMMRELDALRAVTENPAAAVRSRFWAAPKSPTKSGSSAICSTKVDAILIGGAMAYTFLKAQGVAVGKLARRGGQDRARAGAARRGRAPRASRSCCRRIMSSQPLPKPMRRRIR